MLFSFLSEQSASVRERAAPTIRDLICVLIGASSIFGLIAAVGERDVAVGERDAAVG